VSEIVCIDMTSGTNFVLVDFIPGTPGPTIPNTLVNISTSGTTTVTAGSSVFVDLTGANVVVVLNPSGIGTGPNSLFVKLVGATIGAGSSCTINPMVAGNHIENRSSPGALTSSMALGLGPSPGDEITLVSRNAIDLNY
jgi:hypothetical protein